jgi:hypothetical protein
MRMRWMGHVARMGEMINGNEILVGKPVEKRPIGRPRPEWEDNIRIDLEIRSEIVDWIHLAQNRVQ